MDTELLRAQFRSFAGDDRYQRFVRSIVDSSRIKGRLLYWQEVLWKEFSLKFPEAPGNPQEIIDTFTICYLHECTLNAPPSAPHPEIRSTPELADASQVLFPFASRVSLTCPECDSALERWIQANKELCAILRCKTTYEAYVARFLKGNSELLQEFQGKIAAKAKEIAAQMLPGDELWEWDGGGWHCLAGSSGVAIVRNGQIIKRWCEFRS